MRVVEAGDTTKLSSRVRDWRYAEYGPHKQPNQREGWTHVRLSGCRQVDTAKLVDLRGRHAASVGDHGGHGGARLMHHERRSHEVQGEPGAT